MPHSNWGGCLVQFQDTGQNKDSPGCLALAVTCVGRTAYHWTCCLPPKHAASSSSLEKGSLYLLENCEFHWLHGLLQSLLLSSGEHMLEREEEEEEESSTHSGKLCFSQFWTAGHIMTRTLLCGQQEWGCAVYGRSTSTPEDEHRSGHCIWLRGRMSHTYLGHSYRWHKTVADMWVRLNYFSPFYTPLTFQALPLQFWYWKSKAASSEQLLFIKTRPGVVVMLIEININLPPTQTELKRSSHCNRKLPYEHLFCRFIQLTAAKPEHMWNFHHIVKWLHFIFTG